jgi:hypothetical protein
MSARHRIVRSHPTRNTTVTAYVAHPPSHPRAILVKRRASKHVRPHRRNSAAPVRLEKTAGFTASDAVTAAANPSSLAAKPAFDPRFYGE